MAKKSGKSHIVPRMKDSRKTKGLKANLLPGKKGTSAYEAPLWPFTKKGQGSLT
jgi:hypothetical protein